HSETDLLVHAAELRSNRIGHVLADDADGTREGVARPDRPRDRVEGIRELALERVEAPPPPVEQVHDRKGAEADAGDEAPQERARPEPGPGPPDHREGHDDQGEIAGGSLV